MQEVPTVSRRKHLSDVEARDRGQVLSVRFTAAELDDLRERAERAGVPVSAFVRKYALERTDAASLVPGSANRATPSDNLVVRTDQAGGGFSAATATG